MPVCPYCGKMINHLLYREYENRVLSAVFDGERYRDRRKHFGEYRCPKCGMTLFVSENEARAFLKGDLEAQLRVLGVAEE